MSKETATVTLSRARGEKIRIGDNIVIEIIELHGGRVRLGVSAPREVVVNRQEVHEALQREQDNQKVIWDRIFLEERDKEAQDGGRS